MNSYKKLISNSAVFAVGTIGSKLVTFILVPLYTYFLSTEEYGVIDLVTVTISMLIPIVSVGVIYGVLRFALDKKIEREDILKNSLFIALVGSVIFLSLYPVLDNFEIFSGVIKYLYFTLFAQIFQQILAQYTRAVGKIKMYAVNGILLTFSTGVLNILFIAVYNLGVSGYFLSLIGANIISILFLSVINKLFRSLITGNLNLSIQKDMVKYSFPLIPNDLMWWAINSSSRYFINFFSGAGANGLYAVSSRIPGLINIIIQIFNQAWQLSVIEEYGEEEQAEFQNNVFKYYSSILFIASSTILIILKPFFYYVFATDYYESWKAVPYLLIGTVFSSLAGFFGANYLASKNTFGVLWTSLVGGISSIILNIILIPRYSFIGAGISSMISFLLTYVVRYNDVKKYVDFEVDHIFVIKNLLVIIVQTIVLFLNLRQEIEFLILFMLFGILLYIDRKIFYLINVLFQFILNILKKINVSELVKKSESI